MNLVMSDITRNKLGCYMAQQASLNNIPVSALVSRFTVEPSVQQRFENAVKESTEFTKKINVFGVTDQKGEKILLDTTGPIARTNTSYDGTKRRNPNNVVDLKNRKYQCEQVNYDTFISYPQLDAWAAHPDFQSRVSTQIARQVALDRIMIGFNGTSHADESNFSTNKLLAGAPANPHHSVQGSVKILSFSPYRSDQTRNGSYSFQSAHTCRKSARHHQSEARGVLYMPAWSATKATLRHL